MNNEIMKIITLGDIFKNLETEEKAFKFKDYITNLQNENQRLNTNLSELQNAIDNIAELVDVPEGMSVEGVYDKIKDYKSRCEKAIEYINKNILINFGKVGFKTDTVAGIVVDNLLNILNGGDE